MRLAPGALGVAAEVFPPPDLYGWSAEPLEKRGPSGFEAQRRLFHPRNRYHKANLRKQASRTQNASSPRLLSHRVSLTAQEDQSQRRHGEEQHDRADQHAAYDHRGEWTLHLAANTR